MQDRELSCHMNVSLSARLENDGDPHTPRMTHVDVDVDDDIANPLQSLRFPFVICYWFRQSWL
jgi:hypothetical protein